MEEGILSLNDERVDYKPGERKTEEQRKIKIKKERVKTKKE